MALQTGHRSVRRVRVIGSRLLNMIRTYLRAVITKETITDITPPPKRPANRDITLALPLNSAISVSKHLTDLTSSFIALVCSSIL